ncbi:hypothetical protein Q2T41_19055 [Maribacter confluentis]|uniref:Lipocalin-like domain-containing protein n=1 Tax=Maribacter confluentis TaxID=1656093 RepID=A0ABT8RV10_9FLAO|nr:hypothetical protein [Maribacter confluentis]MDO1511057.1 hypothetical protein [Maribacter confluentis]MDO1514759.1 hypothetical protein [Maribacter confluentis]
MKKVTLILRKLSAVLPVLFIAYSCSDDNAMDEQAVITETELQAVLTTDDYLDGVDLALYNMSSAQGTSGKSSNEECYTAEYTDTGYTAVFNNCVLNGTDQVNGTLTVTYDLQGEEGSFTASYVDFYIGEIKVNGSRSYVFSSNDNESAITFEVTSDITVEMEDGSIISDNGTKSTTITFDETASYSVTGEWTVVYEGNTYKIEVNSPLKSDLGCTYIAAGDLDISKNGLTVNVAFGDGTCDDSATMTYPNGVQENITLKD